MVTKLLDELRKTKEYQQVPISLFFLRNTSTYQSISVLLDHRKSARKVISNIKETTFSNL
jgi:hypothetical protein